MALHVGSGALLLGVRRGEPALAEVLEDGLGLALDDRADEPADEPGEGEKGAKLRIVQRQVDRLENQIDSYNARLKALNSFVLPGGTQASADLHLARTVTRRSERAVAALLHAEPNAVNPLAMVYLNRLSDLLFVLARIANLPEFGGDGDVLWVPGSSRDR